MKISLKANLPNISLQKTKAEMQLFSFFAFLSQKYINEICFGVEETRKFQFWDDSNFLFEKCIKKFSFLDTSERTSPFGIIILTLASTEWVG